MDDARFWSLIAKIDLKALDAGDEDAALEPLGEALAATPPAEIEGFEEALAQRLYGLDGERYAREAGESADSGDGFLYARCFVVARGRAHYGAVLGDPTRMPKLLDQWCEALLYVASRAYERATGKAWGFVSSVSYETGSNRARWP